MTYSRKVLCILLILLPGWISAGVVHSACKPGAVQSMVKDTTGEDTITYFEVEKNETIKNYHTWMEKTLKKINEGRSFTINEYVFVAANPAILDSLKRSDYYDLKERGIQSTDPKEYTFIEKGSRLIVPDSLLTLQYMKDIRHTKLVLNIPEFMLRVYRYDTLVDSFMVRVGKNETKFLAMAGRDIDLRTKTGTGKIVAINKKPVFTNPVDNKKYKGTYRDDGVLTKLPNIPWLETEINGIRNGQMIHPTTNLETIGKPVSNGCIGLREKDAWSLYFYAPVGTKIDITYNLNVKDSEGKDKILKDIYEGYKKHVTKSSSYSAPTSGSRQTLCHCGI